MNSIALKDVRRRGRYGMIIGPTCVHSEVLRYQTYWIPNFLCKLVWENARWDKCCGGCQKGRNSLGVTRDEKKQRTIGCVHEYKKEIELETDRGGKREKRGKRSR